MTHEYVIAFAGHIRPDPNEAEPTAVGWAAEAILAVGSDEVVRSISRGDSTFLDLDGCVVTPLPSDLDTAITAVRGAARDPDSVITSLLAAGALETETSVEPGAPADLAFWRDGGLVAAVQAGHFTQGDAHRGPFAPPAARGRSSG